MYCLVYGQMSHWGATVITNLLSAIPFIGGDIVPFTQFLPLYLIFIYIIFICDNNNHDLVKHNNNKTLKNINITETINKSSIDPILLYKFIGFIDGDGYIRVTKRLKKIPGKGEIDYISISLVINLNENDLDLLNKFKSELNLGQVYNITPKKGNKLARLEISKRDIKNILIPLLDYYDIKFLTEIRQKQYLLLKYIINNNLTYYSDINKHSNEINNYINSNIITNKFNELHYFEYWLVGFTMAEGSFYVKKNNDICFQLKQKYNFELFNCIKKVFEINKGISINKDKYIQLTISSKKDIQNVILFFNYEGYNLLGNKLIQYNKWLLDLKGSNRYKDLYINIKI